MKELGNCESVSLVFVGLSPGSAGQYFSGEMALTRVKKNSSLMKWFTEIGDKVHCDSVLVALSTQ